LLEIADETSMTEPEHTPLPPAPDSPRQWPPTDNTDAVQSVAAHAAPRSPDPGSMTARTIALLVLLVSTVCVVILQQQSAAPEAPDPAARYVASDSDMFSVMGRAVTKLGIFAKQTDPNTDTANLSGSIEMYARSPVDQVRFAIIKGELINATAAEAALERVLESLNEEEAKDAADGAQRPEKAIAARETLKRDIELFALKYGEGVEIEEPGRAEIIQRFGWYGRVAVTHGQEPVMRQRLFTGGLGLALLATIFIIGILVVVFGGLTMCAIAIVLIATGKIRPRFIPPLPGGSVYLEMAAVFVASFLLFKLALAGLGSLLAGSKNIPAWIDLVPLFGQWLLLLVIFYPRLRGVTKERWAADLGLTRGKGFIREIRAGLFAYFAGIPLFLFGALLSVMLMFIWQMIQSVGSGGQPGEQALPANPVLERVLGGDLLSLIMLFTLATIWAPLVEEIIFRGALFRHMRTRVPWVVAGILSAFIFGVMHGYQFLMLGPVIALGFIFSAMREWRGSLIAPIFAHALHNATVLTLIISFVTLVK
jgi:membrane protease YdiL (CAAX protease family)